MMTISSAKAISASATNGTKLTITASPGRFGRHAKRTTGCPSGKRDDLVVSGRRRRVDQAEVVDVQMIGNLCQKPVADIFHQWDNGRASICVCCIFLLTDRYRGNHRGSAQKILKQGDGIGRLGKVARRYQDSARRLPGEPAAQNINRRS